MNHSPKLPDSSTSLLDALFRSKCPSEPTDLGSSSFDSRVYICHNDDEQEEEEEVVDPISLMTLVNGNGQREPVLARQFFRELASGSFVGGCWYTHTLRVEDFCRKL